MVFSSVTFLFYFLPPVLVAYWLMAGTRARNALLLFASLLFYAWGEPFLILVMLGSIALNYVAGRLLMAPDATPRAWVLGVSIALNLLLLAVFKYAAFAVSALNGILAMAAVPGLPVPALALPLGISFFTFQAISYLVDVYRGDAGAERNPLTLATYIAMFPQLVAGPIVRFGRVARELRQRRITLGRSSVGVRIFVIGLAQKVLVANQVAPLADASFALASPGFVDAWLGLIAYTIQIYFDFAGYSNMAIGLGLMLGFSFPRNFRLPYAAQSVTDFWRRWHISLSTWFRDYLYIPLGGNRGGDVRTCCNLFVVFLLCGLWHGASWNFVIWGIHHGVFLILERGGWGRYLQGAHAWFRHSYLLLAVMAGWVWFRADDLSHALMYFAALSGAGSGIDGAPDVVLALHPVAVLALSTGIMLAFDTRLTTTRRDRRANPRVLAARRGGVMDSAWVLGLLLVSLLLVATGSYNPFLYFRF